MDSFIILQDPVLGLQAFDTAEMFDVVSHYGKVIFAGRDADKQVEILNGLANGLQPNFLTAKCVGRSSFARLPKQECRLCQQYRNSLSAVALLPVLAGGSEREHCRLRRAARWAWPASAAPG